MYWKSYTVQQKSEEKIMFYDVLHIRIKATWHANSFLFFSQVEEVERVNDWIISISTSDS